MKPHLQLPHAAWRRCLILLTLVSLAFPERAAALGFSEPPVVIQGKVLHLGEGTARQLYAGKLTMTLVAENNPAHTVTQSVELDAIGTSGQLSYRIEIPQRYLPETHELSDNLSTKATPTNYVFSSITIDGEPATPLDSAQALLTTSFSTRNLQHTLDLQVSLPQVDSDGDGIPDWWEELYGLNPNLTSDGSSDTDLDGLNALTEFQNGTDPTTSNTRPLVQATSMIVPIGGQAGLYLKIVDANTGPADITISLDASLPGLTVSDASGEIGIGESFTYADVLAGKIWLSADISFAGGNIPVTVNDDLLPPDPINALLRVETFSPAKAAPAIWLDVADLQAAMTAGDPVSEWADASGNLRDGYQPFPDKTPLYQPDGLAFDGTRFLYVDDRSLALTNFTALVRFNVDTFTAGDQTVFSVAELKLDVGGSNNPAFADSHHVVHNGREILGTSLASNVPGQITLTREGTDFSLGTQGGGYFPSHSVTGNAVSGFPTIGGLQRFTDPTATLNFHGGVQEIIIFDEILSPGLRTRAEEYQRSRWDGLVVWDYRDDALSLDITGTADRENAISGGWGRDVLVGGNLPDTLRGGPSDDTLTGGAAGDRFQLFADHGNDTITDFSETDGDILDLTEIFAGLTGDPADYLSFRVAVVRDANNIPRVNAYLDIDHDGDGSGTDQTITFENQFFTDADLPRLIGQGTILMGGPIYDTTVGIGAAITALDETEVPHTVTVTRTGNLDSALRVPISFTGSAGIDADYHVTGATGSGAVRTVTFAAGAATATLDVKPIIDHQTESEQIVLTLMSSPLITGGAGQSLTLTLTDAPEVQIRTLAHVLLNGPTPGMVEISRSGDLSKPLTLQLGFSGTAVNGVNYNAISTSLMIPATMASVQVPIVPTGAPSTPGMLDAAVVTVVEDLTSFRLVGDGAAEVQFLASAADRAPLFADWRASHFSGDLRSDGDLSMDDDNGNGIPNIFEYLRGTNPKSASGPDDPLLTISVVGGFLELRSPMVKGLTDIQLDLLQSAGLQDWKNAGSDFPSELYLRNDGRIDRVFRSKVPVDSLPANGFQRLGASLR